MSRIGKIPVAVPKGVTVALDGGRLVVKGPKGSVARPFPGTLKLLVDEGGSRVRVGRGGDAKQEKALHGTFRSLLAGMVRGVSEPYVRDLDIVGVGYQAKLQPNQATKRPELRLTVGYANPVDLPIPEALQVECPSATSVKVTGADKELVGRFAASVRKVRPPEPYNGKGIKYREERIQRKQGKSFVTAAQ